MEIILKENVEKLGKIGDVVTVKRGYGTNFLLPQGKAMRATKENKQHFEEKRAELERVNAQKIQDAEKTSQKINAKTFVIIKQAGESGHLFGSVNNAEISEAINHAHGTHITKQQIQIQKPIKTLGIYSVRVKLFAEICPVISINVARSEQEAKMQEKEALTPKITKEEAPEKAEEAMEAATATADNSGETAH